MPHDIIFYDPIPQNSQKSLLEKGSLRYAVMAGLLDMAANVFYLLATRTGFMVTAVIISSLYPAPTVILQRIVLGEKLNFLRICGIVLAITGTALIGIGSWKLFFYHNRKI